MIVKCRCQWCGGHIEFDAAEFQDSGSDPSHIFGQKVACPHCGKETILYLDKKETPQLPIKTMPAPPPGNMRTCWDCGGQVSIHADACPHCGVRLKRPRGVFFYVFWGVLSLIATMFILWFFLIFLGAGSIGLSSFLQARHESRAAMQLESTTHSLHSNETVHIREDLDRFNEMISSDYDKFKETTTFSAKTVLDFGNGLHGNFCVAQDKNSQTTFVIIMVSTNSELRYMNNSQFIVISDDQKFDLGEPTDNANVNQDGSGFSEAFVVQLSKDQFYQTAFAKTVEAELGSNQFTLSYADREPMRLLAIHFQR